MPFLFAHAVTRNSCAYQH